MKLTCVCVVCWRQCIILYATAVPSLMRGLYCSLPYLISFIQTPSMVVRVYSEVEVKDMHCTDNL